MKLTNDEGYLKVTLRRDRKGYKFRVHTLILTVFVGPCPGGCIGCHKDDVKTNNTAENLYWGDDKTNAKDRTRNGHTLCGELHGMAKMSRADVTELKRLHDIEGMSFPQLGKRFNISRQHAWSVYNSKRWKYDAEPERC